MGRGLEQTFRQRKYTGDLSRWKDAQRHSSLGRCKSTVRCCFIPIRMRLLKEKDSESRWGVERWGGSQQWPWGCGSQSAAPRGVKELPRDPASPLLWRVESRGSGTYLYAGGHSSDTHSSQDVATTRIRQQMSGQTQCLYICRMNWDQL